MAKVLVTNNTQSNHSPEMWAMATAEMIIDGTDLSGEKALVAQKLQLDVASALERHHAVVQDKERLALLNDVKRLWTSPELTVDLDDVMDDIYEVTDQSPWKEHFRKPEVEGLIKECLVDHFLTSAKLERQLHADKLQAIKEAI